MSSDTGNAAGKPPPCTVTNSRVITIPEPHIERKVKPIQYSVNENGCWMVVSHKSKNGHGKLELYRNGRRYPLVSYVYQLLRKPLGKYKILVNTCGNDGICCNPDHYGIEDKGYFNTVEYMAEHNPEHWKNVRNGDRRRKVDVEAIKALFGKR